MQGRTMKPRMLAVGLFLFLALTAVRGQDGSVTLKNENPTKPNPAPVRASIVPELKSLLQELAWTSSSTFLERHFLSIIAVLDAVPKPTASDSLLLEGMYEAFSAVSVLANPRNLSSYLERKRPFILSWTSPTDRQVSLAWLVPPENWDPDRAYPLYVRLHGLSDIYSSRIQYLSRYLGPYLVYEGTFEDGWTLLPWGRGNLWYQGVAETDIHECINAAEALIPIDPARKYLTGMSMGGYGAWRIGAKSPDNWAALGIYAAALWYGSGALSDAVIDSLKNVPVFFICGTSDGLLSQNEQAYGLLQDAGNPNLAFETFEGGHESKLECWQRMYAWIRNFTRDTSGMDNSRNRPRPERSGLIANYPNPFNSGTVILYRLRIQSDVEVDIHDAAGRRIRTILFRSETPGDHQASWDGQNDSGAPVPAGVYVCRMMTEESVTSLKILMLK